MLDEVKETRTRKGDRPMKNILVTGGCGFIGSNFINYFAPLHPHCHIYNLDIMDYCANERNVDQSLKNYTFVKGDICSADLVMHLLKSCDIDTIIHFAAQSHVDNSFGNSMCFTKNNVLGTHNLLECSKVYGKLGKFVHVSTDEVYGEVNDSQHEGALLNPTNPYAATKAAAEFIVQAYRRSFDLPIVITRGNNVYGPRQYPEKVIPRFIWLLSGDKKMTIQGSGKQMRTFVHSTDAARAFSIVLEKGILGEIYNIGTEDEQSVESIAKMLIAEMKPGANVEDWITSVPDRDFNDFRYVVNTTKLYELGWQKEVTFSEGLKETIAWYLEAFKNGHWSFINPEIGRPPVNYNN
eukprot:TRINITY_DN7181_c0_g1_i1.p1 TRINITY_DN7181_c0_g1~~TRINITY_DN7181_c0_g1_i1.p1  ORF type:complete len:364 (+),score=162.42 TRINITY_DN7181_c0_g1_i1:37-1092(+)